MDFDEKMDWVKKEIRKSKSKMGGFRSLLVWIKFGGCLIMLSVIFMICLQPEEMIGDLQYLGWKYHLVGHDKLDLDRFTRDYKLRMKLIGKSKAELKKWFPYLIKPEDYPDMDSYNCYLNKKHFYDFEWDEVLWLGKSQWVVFFDDDVVVGFWIMKG